jgi:hypothetical protein
MSTSYAPAPKNKKEYIIDIGKILVKENGKKKYYKSKEVKKAHQNSSWIDLIDFSCWAMSTFSSHSDFDAYHTESGEICNYVDMKSEMLLDFSNSSVIDWTKITAIEIDASWLDFGDIFDGLGEFIGGILDI